MKKNKERKKSKKPKSVPFVIFRRGSFAVHIGDHLRFGIICGPIWGSFPVWGSFAVGDHLRRCTKLLCGVSLEITAFRIHSFRFFDCCYLLIYDWNIGFLWSNLSSLKKLVNLKQNETISDFTYNKDLKSAQNAGNCICGVRKIQKFSGGACPRTPLHLVTNSSLTTASRDFKFL